MNRKKNTTKIAVLFAVTIVGIVGYFAYLSGKSRQVAGDAAMTNTQIVLSRDLQSNYPPTVKEVMKYYTDIEKCFYTKDVTEEEVEQLGMKARSLYDAELLANNAVETNLLQLKEEVNSFKEGGRKITAASVASSANVENFQEDGYDFARIHCLYTVVEGGESKLVDMVYLLRKDEDRRWKIYGWDLAENVKPTEK